MHAQDKINTWFHEYELERDKNEIIQEMIRYKWLTINPDNNRLDWTDERSEKYVNAFLSMSRFFEFHEIQYADCPCFFSMAHPKLSSKSARQHSPYITVIQDKNASGAAFTKRQAAESCLGEAIEIISMVRTGNEDLVYESYNNLNDKALHPNKVIQYSEQQYKDRIQWNKNHLPQHHIPEPFNDDMVIAWTKIQNIDNGDETLYPAKLLYWGFEYEQPNYCNADSNGCAVAETKEEAQTKAILELIERDAAGIWWYGRLKKPGIPHELIEDKNAINLIHWLKKLNRTVEFLDITTDIEIPVIVAVSYNIDGGSVALGYGCSFDIQAAITHSITEMMQMIVSFHMLEERLKILTDKPANEDELEFINWIKNITISKHPFLCSTGLNSDNLNSSNRHMYTYRSLIGKTAAVDGSMYIYKSKNYIHREYNITKSFKINLSTKFLELNKRRISIYLNENGQHNKPLNFYPLI